MDCRVTWAPFCAPRRRPENRAKIVPPSPEFRTFSPLCPTPQCPNNSNSPWEICPVSAMSNRPNSPDWAPFWPDWPEANRIRWDFRRLSEDLAPRDSAVEAALIRVRFKVNLRTRSHRVHSLAPASVSNPRSRKFHNPGPQATVLSLSCSGKFSIQAKFWINYLFF